MQKYLRYYCKIQDTKLNQYQSLWWNMLRCQNEKSILWISDLSYRSEIGKTRFRKWLLMIHKVSQFSPNVNIDNIDHEYECACIDMRE